VIVERAFNKQLARSLRIRSGIDNCAAGLSDHRKCYARNNDIDPHYFRSPNTGMFKARLERCKQLASECGGTTRTQTGVGGMREFVQNCMRGKQR
jgi:hypothetical protein